MKIRITFILFSLVALYSSAAAQRDFRVDHVNDYNTHDQHAYGSSNGVRWSLCGAYFSSCCGASENESYEGFSSRDFQPPVDREDSLHIGGDDFDLYFEQPIQSIVFYLRENGGNSSLDFGIVPEIISGAENLTIIGTRIYPNTLGGAIRLSGLNTGHLFSKAEAADGMNMAFYVEARGTGQDLLSPCLQKQAFPWVSNSLDFESSLIVNNYGAEETTIQFTARRFDGSVESSNPITIPGRGFYRGEASALFSKLGAGLGYTVTLSSYSDRVTGSWMTFDRINQAPSRGNATKLEGSVEPTAENVAIFDYLPGNRDFRSAGVVTNLGSQPTRITVYLYERDGALVEWWDVEELMPLQPLVLHISDAQDGDVHAIAVSHDTPIAGTIFIFNAQNQTAIGNAFSINDFEPPNIR